MKEALLAAVMVNVLYVPLLAWATGLWWQFVVFFIVNVPLEYLIAYFLFVRKDDVGNTGEGHSSA